MNHIQSISDFNAIKVLSDPRRLAILRALMVATATLTHLGQDMDMHPAKVRYHLKLLEGAGLVKLARTQIVGNYTEKYYTATAMAFHVQASILPKGAGEDAIIATGSHDLALELMAESFCQNDKTPAMFTLPVGSLDGLIALRQGLCQVAGCHLLDPIGGDYNTSYVRHFFPGQPMHIITLAHRQQGLLIEQGNPKGIQNLDDLKRSDISFINRNRGSGTRLWLDQQLKTLGIGSAEICGYNQAVNTHAQVAEAVLGGNVDVGLGIFAAARKHNLDFIPLFEERFDLVVPEEHFASPTLAPLFDHLNSGAFHQTIESLAGYDPRQSGVEKIIH
ncbi:MAG: helix-turn-helix domain-containing protein [Anaerolineales bacterium]|nr:helix-turn-helix domain-containing protein [Chloroflexota bacterium]MBL6983268.1 helix-turn-helix domain-containing protein [Anaerolineales bacterium]